MNMKFLIIRAVGFLGWITMAGCIKLDPSRAMLNGNTPQECGDTTADYANFSKISRQCQSIILNKMTELDIAKLLQAAFVEKNADISGVLNYLGQRALPQAPLEILSNLNIDPNSESGYKRLGQLYARSYFRFFAPQTNKPQIRTYEKFCPRVGTYQSECQLVLPLARYGLIAFKQGGRISVIEAASGQRQEFAIVDDDALKSNKNIVFKAAAEYKANHFVILMYDKSQVLGQNNAQFFLINAQLENYKSLKILNKRNFVLPSAAVNGKFHLTSHSDKFIFISSWRDNSRKINFGSWNDPSTSIVSKEMRNDVSKIWPYNDSHIIVREMDRYFLISIEKPLRLSYLPKPLSDLIHQQLASATAACVTNLPNNLRAQSKNGMFLSVNSGEFGSQFFRGLTPMTNRVPLAKKQAERYEFLLEITLGLWGAIDSRGDLVVIDSWSDH